MDTIYNRKKFSLFCICFMFFAFLLPIIGVADSITLSESEIEVIKGKPVTLRAEIDLSDKKIIWETSNDQIATVTNGRIEGKQNGECDILCKSVENAEIFASCHVTVKTGVQKIQPDANSITLLLGGAEDAVTGKLTYSVIPEDASWKDVVWSSANEKIVTVDENGIVKGISAGKATIIAKSTQPGSNTKAQFQVTVNQAVEGIEFESEQISVPVKKSVQLKPTVTPANASDKKLVWSSGDEAIAIVTANGQVSGKSAGSTIITAKAADGSEIEKKISVEVVQPVSKIDLSDKKIKLAVNTAWQLSWSINPEDATKQQLRWESSKESVAVIDENGLVQGVGKGSCVITGSATDGSNVKATVNVQVDEYDVVITGKKPEKVDFDTVEGYTGAMIIIGNRMMGDYDETTVKFKNGCVKSEENGYLIPVKVGDDKVTVTVKHNGRKLVSKKSYSVYVAQSAFEASDSIKAQSDKLGSDSILDDSAKAKLSSWDPKREMIFLNLRWGSDLEDVLHKLKLQFINCDEITAKDHRAQFKSASPIFVFGADTYPTFYFVDTGYTDDYNEYSLYKVSCEYNSNEIGLVTVKEIISDMYDNPQYEGKAGSGDSYEAEWYTDDNSVSISLKKYDGSDTFFVEFFWNYE